MVVLKTDSVGAAPSRSIYDYYLCSQFIMNYDCIGRITSERFQSGDKISQTEEK